MEKFLMYFSLGMFIFLAMLGGCNWMNQKSGIEDDNLIEENIESVIEHRTGLIIDLSPESQEK